MPKAMKSVTFLSIVGAVAFACLYRALHIPALLTAAITCGTAGYHLGVRLLVGALLGRAAAGHDPSKKWYRLRSWEKALYERWRVKSWKDKLPTYHPDSFSPRLHTWEEIGQAMCGAELVHEANCLLSFLPLLGAIWFGALPVFLITSILAAGFDLLFVIVQRYNRSRVLRLADRQKSHEK